jgi:hypothetical protein
VLEETEIVTPSEEHVVPLAEPRLRDGVGFATRVFLAVWFGWGLLCVLSIGTIPGGNPVGVPGLDPRPLNGGWHNFFLAGDRSDALWFLRIATDGYRPDDGSAAFFPLYPAAIRLLSHLPGISPLTAAILLSQACCWGALVVFHALSRREFGSIAARRATRYLALFPTAFFLFIPYTEAPFLLLSLLVFWYARRGEWWLVLLPAIAAGLTRSVAVALVPALLVEAILQGRGSVRQVAARIVGVAAPGLGIALYGLYWQVVHHDLRAPLRAQANWQRHLTSPLTTLKAALTSAWASQGYFLIDLLVVAVAIAAIVIGIRVLRPTYLAYAVVSLLLPLCEPWLPRPLMSMPRFVAVVFPTFWVLAWLVRKRYLSHAFVLGVSAGGFALLGALFANSHSIF